MQHLHWILLLSCWVQSLPSFQAPHLCTVFSNFCKLREELKVTEHLTPKKIIEFGFAWYHAEPHQIIIYCFAVGLHSVPGGVFPVPPVAAHLMTLLPPPSCFQVMYCRLVGHSPTNNMALFSTYKCSNNPQFLHLLWERANAWNISFETLNGGQFTLST